MKYSISKYKGDIVNCIKLCRNELCDRENGINGESTMEQIEKIILPELNDLLYRITNNDLPSLNDRYLNSFANAFTVWGWNMEIPTELFIKLTELNNNYKKL